PDVVFRDPAFGELHGSRVAKMWEMLLSNPNSGLRVSFSDIQSGDDSGSAKWTAEYCFGPKRKKVINHLQASFEFKDGLIIKHVDEFNMWKWSRQALGPVGLFLGWSDSLKKKIRHMANSRLEDPEAKLISAIMTFFFKTKNATT
ncbi:MAG: nuclear transport factor 2 family protein, partial [Flavobacteriales bacterium]|nr:nuclear transport factor 2 family protein [Flavobacteriales bacterium]